MDRADRKIMKRILCTGSDGFIGSNLVKRLDELNYDIVCVDKSPKSERTVKLDVATKQFTEYFKNQHFDKIIHLGSPCSILQFNEDISYCVHNTLEGFRNVLILAEKCGAKLIYPSSGNIYGVKDKPHNEADRPKPINIYGVCKLLCEDMTKHSPVDTIGLRIFCGYGCGEEAKGCLSSVLHIFLNSMVNNISPVVWGNGKQTRDFVHIEDIIEGFINSMSLNGSHIINLASGTSTNYNDLITIINKVLNKNIKAQYVDKPEIYVEKTSANIDLMKKLLKFKPIPLEKGIQRFYEYLQ